MRPFQTNGFMVDLDGVAAVGNVTVRHVSTTDDPGFTFFEVILRGSKYPLRIYGDREGCTIEYMASELELERAKFINAWRGE